MKVEQIRRVMRRVPFRPFCLVVRGGERALVDHPENIFVHPAIITVVGRQTVWFMEPSEVSAIARSRIRPRRNSRDGRRS